MKRVLRTAKNKRKEIEEMLEILMRKAEENSEKFLIERGAKKDPEAEKRKLLGKR